VTPTLPTILLGQVAAMSAPAPPEASGDYAASRLGLIAMLLVLASQEVERAPAALAFEAQAIAEILAASRGAYPDIGPLPEAPSGAAASLSAQAGHNADLRRRLITLHEMAEARCDAALQREILGLYERMAQAWRLDLPVALG
jgi:hypothetical protein